MKATPELPSASELAARLPDWSIAYSDMPRDNPRLGNYDQLKTAAVALASASDSDRRALIAEYSRAYCDLPQEYRCIEKQILNSLENCHRPEGIPPLPDLPKASGLYVLMRVLFVLPAHVPLAAALRFSVWATPWWPTEHRGGRPITPDADLSWPVHEDTGTQTLMVASNMAFYIDGRDPVYRALAEYDYFAARYPMRTPAMLQALNIKLAYAATAVAVQQNPREHDKWGRQVDEVEEETASHGPPTQLVAAADKRVRAP